MGLRILLADFLFFFARSDLFHDIPKFIMFKVPLLIFFAVLFQLLLGSGKVCCGEEEQEDPHQWGKDCENYVLNNKTRFKYRNFVMSPAACVKARCFFSLAVFQSFFLARPPLRDSKNFYVFSLRQLIHTAEIIQPAEIKPVLKRKE